MNITRTIGFILPAVLFVSCHNIPRYSEESPLDAPENYQIVQSADHLEIKDSLLELFDNEELNRVVQRVLENNPDLRRSYAQFEEAGFNFKKSRSGLFPSLTGNGSASRSDAPGFITGIDLDAVPGFEIGGSDPLNNFQVSLDVAWELDVWGRIRSGRAAAGADLAASAANYEAARQSMVAQTMQIWFELVASELSVKLNQRRVDSFKATEELVERRFELGSSVLGDLELARTETEIAKGDLEASRDLRDQFARQLKVLMGDYPDRNLQAAVWPSLMSTVPVGLPSDLLLKRPDIVAAFERIRAADERVDVAHADLFPSFILTASAGRQSDRVSDLSRSAFDAWSIVGNMALPIIDHGLRRSELNAAGKRAEQAFYDYKRIVLNALLEVENALGSEIYLFLEEDARLSALSAAKKAKDRTQRDYEEGLVDILTLLVAQRRVFNTEQQTINVRASRLSNRVRLALALGKGV